MLNVEYVNMQSDDFSPVEAYGYDKYETGYALSHMSGVSRDSMRYTRNNEFFNNVFEHDRLATSRMHEQMTELEHYTDNEFGRVEDFRDISDFRNISRANHLNFLSYAPVQRLVREERISAWGYTPEQLPQEDIIARMIDNGRSEIADDGTTVKRMFRQTDDLDYTRAQLWKFEKQRALIDVILEDTDLDPTDTSLERF